MFTITLYPGAVAIQRGETVYTFAGNEQECCREIISKCCKKTDTGYAPADEGAVLASNIEVNHLRKVHLLTNIPVVKFKNARELPPVIPKEEITI